MKKLDIGKRLLDFRLEGENGNTWTRRQLYNRLSDEIAAKLDLTEIKKGYSMFYLQIIGDYDLKLIPEENACEACPKNPAYEDFHKNSILCDDKQTVLVLYSPYCNFSDYGIKAAYYIDEDIEYEKHCSNIELFGKPKNSLIKMLGGFKV